eukprot:jgi/Chlat1/2942/Chrsp2S04685
MARAPAFWNDGIASASSLDGEVLRMPGDNSASRLRTLQGPRLVRSQQLILMQHRYPLLPVVPAVDGIRGVVVDRALAAIGGSAWWFTVLGRMCLQQAWRRRFQPNWDTGPSTWQVLSDPSLYSLSTRGRLALGQWTTASGSAELPSLGGLSTPSNASHLGRLMSAVRAKIRLRRELPKHAVVLDAVWNSRFMDASGCYQDVPRLLAGSIASQRNAWGIRYKAGVYHLQPASDGYESSLNLPEGVLAPPRRSHAHVHNQCTPQQHLQLQPTSPTHAQAAVTIERKGAFNLRRWRKKTEPPYSLLVTPPGISYGAVVGALARSPINLSKSNMRSHFEPPGKSRLLSSTNDGYPELSTGVFASVGFGAQLGHFSRPILDFTAVSVRVDACSSIAAVSDAIDSMRTGRSFANGLAASADADSITTLWSGTTRRRTLTASVQQQLFGPVRAQVEAQFDLDNKTHAADDSNIVGQPRLVELGYSVESIVPGSKGAMRVVAWYSPLRREGMIELRLLEL